MIVVLDDDVNMRDCMVDLFRLKGWECLGVGSFKDVREHAERVLGSRLAILDVNLGPGEPSGVDVYKWLRSLRFSGQIVFLTGHAGMHPLVQEARALAGVRVLLKPIAVHLLIEIARSAARTGEIRA